jgi:hypothetical protein
MIAVNKPCEMERVTGIEPAFPYRSFSRFSYLAACDKSVYSLVICNILQNHKTTLTIAGCYEILNSSNECLVPSYVSMASIWHKIHSAG